MSNVCLPPSVAVLVFVAGIWPVPASGAPASASVGFGIARVGPAAPMLTVRVHNDGTTPITMTDYADPTCFAERWLRLVVTDGKSKTVKPSACAKPGPGTSRLIAPGAEVRFDIPLAKVFPALGAGSYGFAAGWKSAAPDDAAAFSVLESSLNESRFTIARPQAEVTIARGQTITLPDGAKLTFSGHSHKDVDARSAPGPLIVNGTFGPPKQAAKPFYASVFVESSRMILLADAYAFELVDYVYGESMKLTYYGNLH